MEGKAEEMEIVSREAKEEGNKSGKSEVGRERERVEAHSKRVCLDHFPNPNLCGVVSKRIRNLRWRMCDLLVMCLNVFMRVFRT